MNTATTKLMGGPAQTAGGVTIVTTKRQALDLLLRITIDSVDGTYGVDTETSGWSPKMKRPPKNRARIQCWSIGWNDGTLGNHPHLPGVPLCRRAFLLWTPEIKEVFRSWLSDPEVKKTGHSVFSFDYQAFANEGITLNGLVLDGQSASKYVNNAHLQPHGLKHHMEVTFRYESAAYKELFSRPSAGAMNTRKSVGKRTANRKVEYQTAPVPTLLGLEYQNVCWGRTDEISMAEICSQPHTHARWQTLVDYASLDAKVSLELYYYLKPKLEDLGLWKHYTRVWIPQHYVLTTLDGNGWPFDQEVCATALEDLETSLTQLKRNVTAWGHVQDAITGEPTWPNPKSTQQMQHLLYGRGAKIVGGVLIDGRDYCVPEVCGTTRAVKRVRRGQLPVDEMALLTLAAGAPPEDREYLELLNALKKSMDNFGKFKRFAAAAAEEPDGRARTQFKCQTDTGRLSASNQPWQQVPKKGLLRKAFVADPGYKLIVADFSGLEMRILAHFLEALFGDTRLKEDILSADIHSSTAKRIWPDVLASTPDDLRALEKTDREHLIAYREYAKIINYAINYGKGAAGLGVQIRDENGNAIGTEAAQVLLDNYMEVAYPVIKRWQAWLKAHGMENCSINTLHGRIRLLPALALNQYDRYEKWKFLEDYRRLLNTPIQGSAADLVTMAMLKCNPEPLPDLVKAGWYNETLHSLGVSMLAQVHDELVFHVPEANAEAALVEIKRCMETAQPLLIDTPVDAHIVDCWGSAK